MVQRRTPNEKPASLDNGKGEAIDANLLARLSEFDGKAMTLLGEIEAELAHVPGYHAALIELSQSLNDRVSDGATWLIKSALEKGSSLGEANVKALFLALPNINSWAAQLHICQSIRHLQIPRSHADALANWLDPLLSHNRPFVRAWSLDALSQLAGAIDQYQPAFEAALAAAREDQAASVRARARNLRV